MCLRDLTTNKKVFSKKKWHVTIGDFKKNNKAFLAANGNTKETANNGDRYLNTTLNGLSLPSNDVNKKNIDFLDQIEPFFYLFDTRSGR